MFYIETGIHTMQNLRRYTQNVEHSSTVRQLRVFLETKESKYSYENVNLGILRKRGAMYKLEWNILTFHALRDAEEMYVRH